MKNPTPSTIISAYTLTRSVGGLITATGADLQAIFPKQAILFDRTESYNNS